MKVNKEKLKEEIVFKKYNCVSICDVVIESTEESLSEICKKINELIQKNYDFIASRKQKAFIESQGFAG